MLKFKPQYSVLVVSLLAVLLVFQNCGDGLMATKTSNNQIDFGSQAELIYGHNSDIRMQKASTEAQPVYSNRMLSYNIFLSVFGDTLKNKFVENIAWSGSDIGSGWDLYQKRRLATATCNTTKSPFYRCDNAKMLGTVANISGASAPREARRMAACEMGVDSDASLEHALSKISSDASLTNLPKATNGNYKKAFQLFFRGKPTPDKDFFDALSLVYKNNDDKKEAWKQIVLGICLSPHWQVL